ncbi:ATPase, partial [Bacillus cereus]|uniref:ParA family protein n=1 Tax=Bacillus cereus TaxID=1396 RepID=UPI000C0167C2
FIDVPPMSIEVTKNAVVASDYVLITLQTQERSLTGAENYINQLIKLKEQYNLDIEVVGILPVLLKNDGKVDEFIMENAREIFGEENLFKNIVPQMERIKRFDVNGITENDRHDLHVIQLYEKISDELLSRINIFENLKVGV